jgi:membrane protease YdiL (CAAX protease family)
MLRNRPNRIAVLIAFVAAYALLAAAAVWMTPAGQYAAPGAQAPAAPTTMPMWQLALLNGALLLIIYGLIGLAGLWLAGKLQLPIMYRDGAGWRAWFLWPMLIGLALGLALIVGDRAFVALGAGPGFPHPAFPLSLIASATAGIGEEILFRGLILGLWALLFNFLLRRWHGRAAALWIGNVLAALAFSAGHLPTVMILTNAATPAAIPPLILAELIVLNTLAGLVAGERYIRDGLVAAIGVHFWADVVWHVIWPTVLAAAS